MEEAKSPWRAILVLLYTVSGLTGVAYEVLWARMISIQFGANIFGVVFTVTAFMAGLGIGSLAGMRWKAKNPILTFSLLEAGVAIYALFLPSMLHVATSDIEMLSSRLDLVAWYGLQGAVSIAFLMLPAAAMGASFPMVLKAGEASGLKVGTLYGINTAGAAIGALLPLGLLPELGWIWALRLVAMIGLMVGVGAFLLARNVKESGFGQHAAAFPKTWAMLPYAGIGACSLMLQVGWTRLYSLVLLRTEYVLAVILCVFLAGMGLGSLLARKGQRSFWLSVLPILAAGFAIGSLWLYPSYSDWVEGAKFDSLSGALTREGLILALMTLPVTLVLGAWLPLLAAKYKAAGEWLYGINSLGAAIGAMAGGFILIPLLGTTGTIVVAALGLAFFGLMLGGKKLAWAALPLMIAFSYPVFVFPKVEKLLPLEQAGSRDLYRYEDALAITHVVQDEHGEELLLTDLQRMDASTDPTAVVVQMNQARLPLLLHPEAHSILFLGLGTGISAAGSLPYPALERTAVELSQGAINASRKWFASSNQGVMNRMDVKRDDARHYLTATNRKYDVIVGDLFHPDLTGVGALLSVEEFAHAREKLTEDGIFVQWIALNQFDPESLRAVLRSFQAVFPNAVLFIDGMHLAMVGPNGRMADIGTMRSNLARLGQDKAGQATGGEGIWTWAGRYWGPIRAGNGPMQEEWAPKIEFSLPKARYDGAINITRVLKMLMAYRPDVREAESHFGVDPADSSSFDRAYIGSDLAARSWVAYLQGDEMAALKLRRYAYEANPRDRWIASTLADNMMASLPGAVKHGMDKKSALLKVLEVYPDNIEALRAMVKLEHESGNRVGEKQYRDRLVALAPLDKEVRQ
ncbi:MAG: fused MFS/spermidine synthase [Burkholderiales bacterium]|nr:fused MFS/spermidine synthase [Burkholderiales bacterium]